MKRGKSKGAEELTVKEYLQQYRRAAEVVRRLEAEYHAEENLIGLIGSGVGDGASRGSSVGHPTEEQAIRLAEKKESWRSAALDAIEIRQEVFNLIHDVPGEMGDVLIERYINCKSWTEVAASIPCSRSTAFNLHTQALRFLEQNKSLDYLGLHSVL